MKNYIFLLFAGCMLASVNTSASDADVGKTKNSELVIGQYDDCYIVACESIPVVNIYFESQTIELVNSPANEFGILPDVYTGERMYYKYISVNYWILYKYLIDQPKHSNAILAPRDKLSC